MKYPPDNIPCKSLMAICVLLLLVSVSASAADSGDIARLVKNNAPSVQPKASPIFEGRGDGVRTCPVTGEIIRNKAYKAEFHGRTWYFCCKGCQQTAKHDPDRFIKPTAAEQSQAVKQHLAKAPQMPSGEEYCLE